MPELCTIRVDGSRQPPDAQRRERAGPRLGGRRAARVHERQGRHTEIYVAAADGANTVRLTVEPAAYYQPNFSPDGSRIAFASDRDDPGHIFVMGADGWAQTSLASSDTSSDHDPSFSPDGCKVALAGEFYCPPGCARGEILGAASI